MSGFTDKVARVLAEGVARRIIGEAFDAAACTRDVVMAHVLKTMHGEADPREQAQEVVRHAAALELALVRTHDALRGMIGLVRLVAGRYEDFPVDNHRVLEAISTEKELTKFLKR